jgi:hypothetical protein
VHVCAWVYALAPIVATKGEAAIKAATEMRARFQMALEAGGLDVGVLAASLAFRVQRAHFAAMDDLGAVRGHHPERTRVCGQFGDVRKQVSALLEVALMARIEGFVVAHVGDEVGAARRLLDAIGSPTADHAVRRRSQVARHIDDHDARQDVLGMVDVGELGSGSVKHILWGANQQHVINVYHIGGAGHNVAWT